LMLIGCLWPAHRAAAVTLTADYSSLGTVYQDASGNFYSSAGVGRTDVTATFKLDITTAFTYLQSAIKFPWNETVRFQLFDFTPNARVADSGITGFDGNGANNTVNRPASSTIRYNTHAGYSMFLDSTPGDNSEFSMSSGTAALGGGNVNNKLFGNATAAAASNRWDFLTLTIHELEHSLGISSGSQRFLSLAGASTN